MYIISSISLSYPHETDGRGLLFRSHFVREVCSIAFPLLNHIFTYQGICRSCWVVLEKHAFFIALRHLLWVCRNYILVDKKAFLCNKVENPGYRSFSSCSASQRKRPTMACNSSSFSIAALSNTRAFTVFEVRTLTRKRLFYHSET
jgi:hypothetical protein